MKFTQNQQSRFEENISCLNAFREKMFYVYFENERLILTKITEKP